MARQVLNAENFHAKISDNAPRIGLPGRCAQIFLGVVSKVGERDLGLSVHFSGLIEAPNFLSKSSQEFYKAPSVSKHRAIFREAGLGLGLR